MAPGQKQMAAYRTAVRCNKVMYLFTGVLILLVFYSMLRAVPIQLRSSSPKEENRVKANILIKFALMAEWPKDSMAYNPKSPFIIGVVGDKTILPYLEKAIKKKKFRINDKPIKALPLDNIEFAPTCQMLFFSDISDEKFDKISELLDNAPVLTVANSKDFQEKKVMINLFIDESPKPRLRFNISRTVVKKSGILLTSKIMKHAVKIFDE